MKSKFAKRAQGLQRSTIRELLKVSQQPGIISFSGGFPDPELFPYEELGCIAKEEITRNYAQVLTYSTTEGDYSLRQTLIEWLRKDGIVFSEEEVIITTGSQQGLDLLAKAFIDPGDVVICGLPTYLGAIQAFRSMSADLRGVPLDQDGMNTDVLEGLIQELLAQGKNIRFIYTVPDFQNPSTATWSRLKRHCLLNIANKYDLFVVEDMPYRQLRFMGERIPSLAEMDQQNRVIVLFTLSKVLAPGLRLGVLAGPEEVVEKATILKQPADLCTSPLSQRLAYRFFSEQGIDLYIKTLCSHYETKCGVMVQALEDYMPKFMGLEWTKPEGGLFIWMQLPEVINTETMLKKALEEKKIAYVPGSPFFVNGSGHNTLRLCFSQPTLEEIREGIKRLGQTIAETIHELERLA